MIYIYTINVCDQALYSKDWFTARNICHNEPREYILQIKVGLHYRYIDALIVFL